MEDDNGLSSHNLLDLLYIVHEGLTQHLLVINIDGTLDMTKVILVIKSTVDDNNRMRLISKQICQSLTIYWVANWGEWILKVELWQQLCFIIICKKGFVDTERVALPLIALLAGRLIQYIILLRAANRLNSKLRHTCLAIGFHWLICLTRWTLFVFFF